MPMCPYCRSSERVIKKGSYCTKRAEKPHIPRFRCRACGRGFSTQTGTLTYRQKRPELHRPLFALLASAVSQRRSARLLGTTQVTVARKLVRLAHFAALSHLQDLQALAPATCVEFDEMETFEHSKCKPLAIALAVDQATRRIVGARVARMPAKGKLAAIARRRYGYRKDMRRRALAEVLRAVKAVSVPELLIKSDRCPRYPALVREHLPQARHITFKGRRGCVVGQGELKAGGFDPLFSLNHTCAMYRDNVKCLSRRTWCTTKRPDRLQARLNLYVCAHNASLKGHSHTPSLFRPLPICQRSLRRLTP